MATALSPDLTSRCAVGVIGSQEDEQIARHSGRLHRLTRVDALEADGPSAGE
jgi:hypothetical protein